MPVVPTAARPPPVPRGSFLVYGMRTDRPPRYRVFRSYARACAYAVLLGGGFVDKCLPTGELSPISTVFDDGSRRVDA